MIDKPSTSDFLNETNLLLEASDIKEDDPVLNLKSIIKIYHRKSDNTYWRICYNETDDYNGLLKENYICNKVRPILVKEYEIYE